MRNLFTAAESGLTSSALRWGERQGRWRRVIRGVYIEGGEEPTEVEVAAAEIVRVDGVANGRLAAVLHNFDGVWIRGRRFSVRRRELKPDRIVVVAGVRCTSPLQTLIDLAAEVGDAVWEQALESALRTGGTTLDEIRASLPDLSAARTPGVRRIRRVLMWRGDGPATGSLLETLMVQLARRIARLGPPQRQYEVRNAHGDFVAYVDLAWPELGLFLELDGQQHKDQPVYDAIRETNVVVATGWLCGRFTWHEVHNLPTTTVRRLAALAEQARRRPLPV